jgi:hypothetical protein
MRIKTGDPQPIDCLNCKGKYGYQYADFMKIHYTTHYDEEGKHTGGQYSECSRMINKGVTAYCCNCGERLNFKLTRVESEELEPKHYPKGSIFV